VPAIDLTVEVSSEKAAKDERLDDENDVGFVPPAYCREHDCPEFDVLRSGKEFEVRKYAKAKWLTYNITAHNPLVQDEPFKKSIQTGMELIREYNAGKNKHGLKIPMTVPVCIFMDEHHGHKHNKVKYIVGFYIPVKFQSDPPKPLDERLNIFEAPHLTVAVRPFHVNSQEWSSFLLPEVDKLAIVLSRAGEKFNADHTFVSYYDYPQTSQPAPIRASNDDYNEVWLTVRE